MLRSFKQASTIPEFGYKLREVGLSERPGRVCEVLLCVAVALLGHGLRSLIGKPSFWGKLRTGKYAGIGSGKATEIRSFRQCKQAAGILGLTGDNMWLSLICR